MVNTQRCSSLRYPSRCPPLTTAGDPRDGSFTVCWRSPRPWEHHDECIYPIPTPYLGMGWCVCRHHTVLAAHPRRGWPHRRSGGPRSLDISPFGANHLLHFQPHALLCLDALVLGCAPWRTRRLPGFDVLFHRETSLLASHSIGCVEVCRPVRRGVPLGDCARVFVRGSPRCSVDPTR
jgi:hypothetical protein